MFNTLWHKGNPYSSRGDSRKHLEKVEDGLGGRPGRRDQKTPEDSKCHQSCSQAMNSVGSSASALEGPSLRRQPTVGEAPTGSPLSRPLSELYLAPPLFSHPLYLPAWFQPAPSACVEPEKDVESKSAPPCSQMCLWEPELSNKRLHLAGGNPSRQQWHQATHPRPQPQAPTSRPVLVFTKALVEGSNALLHGLILAL